MNTQTQTVSARVRGTHFDLKGTMNRIIMETTMKVYHQEDLRHSAQEMWIVYSDGAIWHAYDRGPSGKEDFRIFRQVRDPGANRNKALWPIDVFPKGGHYIGFTFGCMHVETLEIANRIVDMMLEG